ncbi:MAG: energy-coupling factor transporter ATPase [Syntrophales bacterium]|nr:energy-coupling factor transporter ATPase [Syntrophales bacterium]
MTSSIVFDHLSFSYQNTTAPALQDISGEMTRGSFTMVMGHSGAGKSTLCCAINGLVPRFLRGIYEGMVMVEGMETGKNSVPYMARIVGIVLQDFEAQLFSTNVELEMAFGLENQCLPRTDMEERINDYLRVVGLEELLRRDTGTLSGGQKQRLAIGSVLAMETPVLVMDEPTTDIDPEGRHHILSLIRRLRTRERTLVVTDLDAEAAVQADQIWLLKDGQLVAKGPPAEILQDSSLIESCGIRPLATVALFQAMNWPGQPLTVEAAAAEIENRRLLCPRRPECRAISVLAPGKVIMETRNLSYRYPASATNALNDVDLTIHEGDFVAMLGQNGSGKTTLAKHFNGLLKPTAGDMLVRGRPVKNYRRHELAREVGYVFQNPDHQIFAPTVREEVSFGPRILGMDRKTLERNIAEALDATGLSGFEDKNPFLLNRGERQRVAVASILAVKPAVIILDEPTTGLDYVHQRDTMEMLKRLNQFGHTIIIITHAMWIAEAYASRSILMKEGRILLDGPTSTVFSDEAMLAAASLAPSDLIRLRNRLGLAAMTLSDMVKELKNEAVPPGSF